MSYQVIARKYRPQRFADVVGQEHVTRTLSQAITQHRIAHAYLFCGPRGTGKTTVARIFAKCLNCSGGPKAEFDEADPRCVEITEGRSLDVLEIDGASNNGVEQVRELRETCKYAPASSKFKIYIIDEVHMLSTAAFNALLKTLEEPPAHVKFMFATTDPEKVLPTILSRCQRFDLRRIPAALISKHLTFIADREKVNIDPAALYAIARGAEGGMRDAESTLDQLISFCGDKIEEADVLSMFGLTAQSQLIDLARAVLAGEIEASLRQLNDLAGKGKDLGRLVSDLLNHFRNLLIFRVSGGDLTMLEVSEAEASILADQSSMASPEGLTRILEVFGEAEMRLRDAASKKILVEVALLKAIEARAAISIDAVLKQLQELRSGTAGTIISKPTEARAPAATISRPAPDRTSPSTPTASVPRAAAGTSSSIATAEVRETATAPGGPAGSDLAQLWLQLIEAVGRASPFTRTYLLGAHPVALGKNAFTIGFDRSLEDQIGLVDTPNVHALLRTKLAELGYHNVQPKFVVAEKPGGASSVSGSTPTTPEPERASKPAAAPTRQELTEQKPSATPKTSPVPFNKEDFKKDPLIQKALEVFKAQIVEVRSTN